MAASRKCSRCDMKFFRAFGESIAHSKACSKASANTKFVPMVFSEVLIALMAPSSTACSATGVARSPKTYRAAAACMHTGATVGYARKVWQIAPTTPARNMARFCAERPVARLRITPNACSWSGACSSSCLKLRRRKICGSTPAFINLAWFVRDHDIFQKKRKACTCTSKLFVRIISCSTNSTVPRLPRLLSTWGSWAKLHNAAMTPANASLPNFVFGFVVRMSSNMPFRTPTGTRRSASCKERCISLASVGALSW
mmetsp:Transcript_60298/g.174031  ORF Transcript_60298/g.174031 Transcript_60298/m.174031 type:complete len:256 (-) Transcript_60298:222-989(-)